MEKYETYSLEGQCMSEDRPTQKLPKQSRGAQKVNQIFYRIMGKDLGAVEYDACIVSGAVFEEKPEGTGRTGVPGA